MRSVKLQSVLIALVVISGITALLISAAFALYKTNHEFKLRAESTAQIVQQQLAWQMLKVDNQVMLRSQFPDFYLWKNANNFSGLCVTFENNKKILERSMCSGDLSEEDWPVWFEHLYLRLFDPGQEVKLEIKSKTEIEGWVTVTPSVMVVLHKAWQNITTLMTFSSIVILIMCTLLYLSLQWILRPIHRTQQRLAQMSQGDLTVKVPNFHIQEWQDTATAINTLATNLNKTLEDRKQLSVKLLHVQESERRYLCRELHDELGQALTGLRALAYFIEEEVQERCPDLSTKVQQISLISQHMMELVKALLFRLRPADLDELGISESLKSMVTEWNSKHTNITCHLALTDNIDDIPVPIAVNLLRTVQECLTNIVKHASATSAEVQLNYLAHSPTLLELSIQDNGCFTQGEHLNTAGNGLLGIQERIAALNGELSMSQSTMGGLKVSAIVPIAQATQTQVANAAD